METFNRHQKIVITIIVIVKKTARLYPKIKTKASLDRSKTVDLFTKLDDQTP